MKKVAITIDDLPVNSMFMGYAHVKYVIDHLVEQLNEYNSPATGFVIESSLYLKDELSHDLTNLLKKWLDAGHDLANHTFSHKSYRELEIDEYLADILNGDKVISTLLSGHAKRVRYFRSPYLDTGDSPAKRLALERFLKSHGYTMAPITIDGWDWKFNVVYENMLKENDRGGADRIAKEYIKYTSASFLYRERQSVDLFGYEIPQILLLHANTINAEYLGYLLQMIRDKQYEFVSLDEVLMDNCYQSPDLSCTRNGQSWLDRWAFSLSTGVGACVNYFPHVPDCIKEIKGKAEA